MRFYVPEVRSALAARFAGSHSLLLPARTRWRIVSLAALVAIAVGASGFVVVDRESSLPDDVAVRVGDQNVTKHEVDHRMQVLKALYGVQQSVAQSGHDSFRKESAKAVALSVILERAERARNISISEESARNTLNQMITKQLPGGREAFINLLRDYGASEQDILDEIKRQQSADILFHRIGSGGGSQVTDDSVLKYFNEHRAIMVSPEQRSMQNIVVASEDQAKEVLARARSGGDLSELVQQYSLDESTKNAHGVLGPVEKRQLESTYGNRAFSAAIGMLFGPVRTSRGWNIGRVVDIKPATPLQFQQVKERLRSQLGLARASETWRNWLAGEMQSAHIKYAAEYHPADPRALPPNPPLPLQANSAPHSASEGTR